MTKDNNHLLSAEEAIDRIWELAEKIDQTIWNKHDPG